MDDWWEKILAALAGMFGAGGMAGLYKLGTWLYAVWAKGTVHLRKEKSASNKDGMSLAEWAGEIAKESVAKAERTLEDERRRWAEEAARVQEEIKLLRKEVHDVRGEWHQASMKNIALTTQVEALTRQNASQEAEIFHLRKQVTKLQEDSDEHDRRLKNKGQQHEGGAL